MGDYNGSGSGNSGYYYYGGNEEEESKDLDPGHTTALIVFRILVCVLGVIGNALVIFVILVLREYKKAVTNWYVLQLAIADSLFLLTIPFKLTEDFNNQEWIFSRGLCKMKEAILYLNYYASVFFLMVMSVDRYIAVCHVFSQRMQKFRTKKTAHVTTLIIWTVSLAFCTPIFIYSDKRGDDPTCHCNLKFPKEHNGYCDSLPEGLKRTCLEIVHSTEACSNLQSILEDEKLAASMNASMDLLPSNYDANDSLTEKVSDPFEPGFANKTKYEEGCSYANESPYWIQYLYANFIIMFVIPFMIMSICYLLIALRLKQSGERRISLSGKGKAEGKKKGRSASSQKAEQDRMRVTYICLALVVSFVVCWLPFHAVHLAKIKGMRGTKELCLRIASWTSIIAYLNSTINPYIYNFIGKKFIKRLRSAVGVIQSSVQERTTSLSSSTANVRFRRKKSSNAGLSSSSGTVMTKLHKGRKSEVDSSRAQSSRDQDSTTENKAERATETV